MNKKLSTLRLPLDLARGRSGHALILILISVLFLPPPSYAKQRKRILELKKEEIKTIPALLPLPQIFTSALGAGDISEAVRVLRMEPASYKSLHLLREAQKITTFDKKAKIVDPHLTYLNLGIAYHNLYLFLLRQGIEQKTFSDKAVKVYKKSMTSRGRIDKSEARTLIAAVYAARGDVKKAQKYFRKVDTMILESSYRGASYLATYHAAMGDVYPAVSALKKAYIQRPDEVALWVAICDDFFKIENEPIFLSLFDEWKIAKLKREPSFTIPRGKKPTLTP